MDVVRTGAPVGWAGRVALVGLREAPLSVDECLAAVARPEVGGTALFVGTVRDHDDGRHDGGEPGGQPGGRGSGDHRGHGGPAVTELEYIAHPRAWAEIERVAAEVASIPGVWAVAVVHRVGVLAVGDVAVVAAAGAVHRAEAFEACRQLIDRVKDTVPIWKRQAFDDGSTEWVGAC